LTRFIDPEKKMARKSKVEFFKDAAGEHRWRVWASNGRVIGESGEGYKRPSGAEDAFAKLAAAICDIFGIGASSEPAPPKPRKQRAKKSAPPATDPPADTRADEQRRADETIDKITAP
jgi:uncharacterized protein YegP (UPF0339 family)